MKINQLSLSVVLISRAMVFSTLLSSVAHAAGATQLVYSPIFCQPFGGALWIYPSGQIGNKGSETMRVFCPLMHEAKHNHSGKLQIFVVQANRHERVECRAFFNHPHANEDPPWLTNGWKGKSANSAGIETATITLPGNTYIGGSHMIECKIPPKSTENNFDGVSRIGTYKSGVD
jgi:hypothetical protein